jgi:type II secretory pathway component GspD/PulD (secretin)
VRPTVVALALVAVLAVPAAGQQVRELEFRDQPVVDILAALGALAGRSIVPDETVGGNASYYFASTDVDTALGAFLATYRFHAWTEGGITFVSRVLARRDPATGTASLDADDVDLRLIVRALSRALGTTILFDALPRETLTVHASGADPAALLGILVRRFPDFVVESGPGYYYLRDAGNGAGAGAPGTGAAGGTGGGHPAVAADGTAAGEAGGLVRRDGDRYSLDVDRARFRDVLADFFRAAGLEYSLFLRSDVMLENLHFAGKERDELARLVMEQASADYAVENGIWYVFDIQRADVLKKLKEVRQVNLAHLAAQDLPALLPQDLATQALYRVDRAANSVILSGSREEIGPLEEFIRALDRPADGRRWCRYDLDYLEVGDLAAVLPPSLAGARPIPLPQDGAFVILLTPESRALLDEYLPLVDRRQPATPVRLRYLSADALLKSLPPSVAKEDVLATPDPTLVFFAGSDEQRRGFLRELELLDRPAPQVRYELLVLQFQEGRGMDWTAKLAFEGTPSPAPGAFLGSLGELLNLNFNIVSTFGYLFALQLNLGLESRDAEVLADTSLTGLSGQELRFQNTETARYRETEIDPATGKPLANGVTREITTGLIIAMNGWVSGDGMITMKVTSTVSRLASADSDAAGALPATSEKIVSTNVRTPSGTPVVIGGLRQENREITVRRTPVLGDIPLLGLLFQRRVETAATTELVICIVPHVEYPSAGAADAGRRMEELYEDLARGAGRD